jgi:hypothetical protein
LQPLCTAAVLVLRFGDDAAWAAVGALLLAVAFLALAATARRVVSVGPKFEPIALGSMGVLVRLSVPCGKWVVCDALGEPVEDQTQHCHGIGRLYEDTRHHPLYAWLELGLSALLGVLAGVRPQTRGGCAATTAVTTLVFASWALVVAWRRYRAVPVANVGACASATLLAVATGIVFRGQLRSTPGGVARDEALAVAWCVVGAEAVAMVAAMMEGAAWAITTYHNNAFIPQSSTESVSVTTTTSTGSGVPSDRAGDALGNPLLDVLSPEGSVGDASEQL